MDSAQAKLFAELLRQEATVDEWTVKELLGYGKSAVVMRAEKEGSEAALKIFHPELIERFGLPAQVIRIEREKMLIDNGHPSLVRILGGGVSKGTQRPYIAMGLVPGTLLGDVLSKVPRIHIASLIEQLARAAKHLEDLGVVHRDIKPDNIKLTDEAMSKMTLLDFGVIRPVGDSSATDQPGHKPFVGTHQYSSPEMLHRTEEDSVEGWRAITFYQAGAVLHDLIMRKPIFDESKEPYANLVVAIDTIVPKIDASDVDPALISLARRCLLKNPAERLRLVAWDDFFFSEKSASTNIETRKALLFKRQQVSKLETPPQPLEKIEKARLDSRRPELLRKALRGKVDSLLGSLADHLPPRTVQLLHETFPNPVVHCTFPAYMKRGFRSAFHFQFSLIAAPDSSVVEIYARAGIGEASNEIGWTHIGGFLDDLGELHSMLESWVVGILEQLVEA